MVDKDALKSRDDDFARRLHQRDATVLVEIARAYSNHLYMQLRKSLGSGLREEDIEEVAQDALFRIWTTYDRAAGAPVRWFYFEVARKKAIDVLRRRRTERMHLPRLSGDSALDNIIDDHETCGLDATALSADISRLIHVELQALTDRQRLAFKRRYCSELDQDNSEWAKRLSQERGHSAKYWRKASDEAKVRITAALIRAGVTYSKEGGRYEVQKSNASA